MVGAHRAETLSQLKVPPRPRRPPTRSTVRAARRLAPRAVGSERPLGGKLSLCIQDTGLPLRLTNRQPSTPTPERCSTTPPSIPVRHSWPTISRLRALALGTMSRCSWKTICASSRWPGRLTEAASTSPASIAISRRRKRPTSLTTAMRRSSLAAPPEARSPTRSASPAPG